jgi:hypothetical protein
MTFHETVQRLGSMEEHVTTLRELDCYNDVKIVLKSIGLYLLNIITPRKINLFLKYKWILKQSVLIVFLYNVLVIFL